MPAPLPGVKAQLLSPAGSYDDSTNDKDYELRGSNVSVEEPWMFCRKRRKNDKINVLPFTGLIAGAYTRVLQPVVRLLPGSRQGEGMCNVEGMYGNSYWK